MEITIIKPWLAVIDRLIQLCTYKNKREISIFEGVLTPVFEDLLLIHGDYIRMFEEVAGLLPEFGTSIWYSADEGTRYWWGEKCKKAAEVLRCKRLMFEPVRTELGAIVKELKDINLSPEASEFVERVIDYFPTGYLESYTNESAYLLEKLNYWSNNLTVEQSNVESNTIEPNGMHAFLQVTISSHRNKWSEVCEAFARLKLKVKNIVG